MSVQPIKPEEVTGIKEKTIPDAVFEIFNELIVQHFGNGYSIIRQKEVVGLLVERGFNREEIFTKGWLDIEPIYRKAGWKVVFDKPGYNEDYEATFKFSRG